MYELMRHYDSGGAGAGEGSGKRELPVADLQVTRLSDPLPEDREELAQLYHKMWSSKGGSQLGITLEESRKKMDRFDLRDTFVVRDGSGKIFAAIQTLPVEAGSIRELAGRFPYYSDIEQASYDARSQERIVSPTHRICFSIVADSSYRVRVGEEPENTVSLSQFLINGLKNQLPDSELVMPFSRFDKAQGWNDPLAFYLTHLLSAGSVPGPVGMHMRLGAYVTGIADGARPEDSASAGSNVWLAYARNNQEKRRLDEAINKLRDGLRSWFLLGDEKDPVKIREIIEAKLKNGETAPPGLFHKEGNLVIFDSLITVFENKQVTRFVIEKDSSLV